MLSAFLREIRSHRSKISVVSTRYSKYVVFILIVVLVYVTVYLARSTPLPVYVLDQLNLRPFFLPNIACPNCNNFSYSYNVENRNFCSPSTTRGASSFVDGESEVFLLILVATFHANSDARNAIRKSWGGVREYRGLSVRTLFMFGRHDDPNYNYQVRWELDRYGDVIQADFYDHYRWLTNKTMMGLRWVREFCPEARYVLKTDDDGFNVPQRFVDYLIGLDVNAGSPSRGDSRFIGGYCFTVMPDRRDGSKFHVPRTMYPDQYYPTYCSGPGYVLSREAVIDVVAVADNVLFLPMEDVFVSGVCRVATGITYTQIVGVAEDQRQMTKCNLAVWVKNGHNIYPQMTPLLWTRAVAANRLTDCMSRDLTTLVIMLTFVIVWTKHLYYIVGSGIIANTRTDSASSVGQVLRS